MRQEKQFSRKHIGLTVFHQFLILFMGMGLIIVSIMVAGYLLHEQKEKKEGLKSQFTNSLKETADYFNVRYTRQIISDLNFIEKSDSFRI